MYPELLSSHGRGAVLLMYLDTRVDGLVEARILHGGVVDQEVGGTRSSQGVDQVVVRILL